MRDYLKLYEALGVRVHHSAGEQVLGFCPVHNDEEKPSFSFRSDTGLYKCFVSTCKAFEGGNYEKLCRLLGKEPVDAGVPEMEIVARHQRLLSDPQVLNWLNKSRGITHETILKYQLGYEDERIWIPIKVRGQYVNVRKHSILKRAKVKTMSYRPGFGTIKLWPDSSIKEGRPIVICEGELDCLLANQMGFNAVTCTGGAGTWKEEFTELLRPVSAIHLLYDVDLAGRSGASNVAKQLQVLGKPIKDVRLPINEPANADLTDYVVTYGGTRQSLEELIEGTNTWTPETKVEIAYQDTLHTVDLASVSHPSNLGRRVQFKATVMGLDSTPYVVPKVLKAECARAGSMKKCAFCPIFREGGSTSLTVPEYSQDILRSFDVTETQQRVHFQKVMDIVPGCPHWTLKMSESYIVHDARVVPEINYATAIDTEYTMRQAYVISPHIKANHTYEFEGTPYSNPKDQYFTILLDKATPVKSDLDQFQLTPEQLDQLKIFQPASSISGKMYDIAHDLSLNVTHIIDRELLLVAMDLAYHSVLSFYFQKRYVNKGRVDLLVLGDTRCGKSESFIGIVNHYRAGEIITGENTSKAGLLGGAQQTGDRWITTWGKLPMNDRRLLIVDEISGMSVEDIGQLSGVRASGIAEINKIQSEKMLARTRTIWAGNPRSNRPLAAYDTGAQAIQELIGRPEDIARFDIAIALKSGEVSLDRINAVHRPEVEHIYTQDLCHKLVMWAWSRKPEDVVFEKEAEQLCLELATKMSQRYSAAIPLVEGAEQRIKLARLSVACAVRLFSTLDGEKVIVTPGHVQYVHDLLEEVYSGPGLNYLAYSKVKLAEQNLKDDNEVTELLKLYGGSFVEGLLDHSYLRLTDLEDMLALEKKEVKPIVSKLLKQKAIKHYGSFYVKTPAFITLLRKLQIETLIEPEKREVEF